jgi:hypothetical protein
VLAPPAVDTALCLIFHENRTVPDPSDGILNLRALLVVQCMVGYIYIHYAIQCVPQRSASGEASGCMSTIQTSLAQQYDGTL